MKLTTQRMLGLQTLWLRAFVMILSFVLTATAGLAQESTQVDEATKPAEALVDSAKPAPAKPAADTQIPDAIQALMPSIVTVTRIEPSDGAPAKRPVSHAGIVVDPRGYIVVPLLPSQSQAKLFVVRLANQKEFVGELAAIDESLKFGVLKIESPQPLVAVSLAKSREARVDDRVKLVPSPASKELLGGRVTSTTIDLGEDGSTKLIQSDVTFPLSEYGSLMVSELGEPLGILMASRTSPKPESMALPLKAVLPLIMAAIDKPKDVPLVRVPASPPPADLRKPSQLGLLLESGIGSFEPGAKPVADLGKPVQISLRPATRIAKLLVEHFGTRGARVLDFEEGKRLKIEAPPFVLVELGQLLADVFREPQKPESKAEPVEPTTSTISADPKMPDITGTWGPYARSEVMIRRVENGSADFEMTTRLLPQFKKSDPYAEDTPPRKIKWFPEAQHFQTLDARNRGIASLTMKANADGKSMHVTITINGKPVDERFGINSGEMEWTRTESSTSIVDGPDSADARDPSNLASTTTAQKMRVYEPQFVSLKEFETALQKLFQGRVQRVTIDQRTNSVIIFAEPAVLAEVDALHQVLDVAPSRKPLLESSRFDALPDTPAAKQLVEQLHAQESAAAVEAATIRQLQASGQAEQNKQPIAEHQRKLKNLLSTAFDLKLQLEELQVKELQSRLSRLERQIGQRKELREKIIARRAGELIEGDALKWNVSDINSKKERPDLNGSTSQIQVIGSAADETNSQATSETTVIPLTRAKGIVIDLYGGSKVLPGLSENPSYSKLIQSLNALKGVTTNFREAGDGAAIVMAIVRDPSQRCRREAQRTQKESELRIAINAALKAAGIEATQWEENIDAESADKSEAAGTTSTPDPTLSPEKLREQLEPFAKRVTAAEARVRELETVYFRGRKNAAELQQAFDELTQARSEFRVQMKSIPPGDNQNNASFGTDYEVANRLVRALDTQHQQKQKLLAEGKATEAEVEAVANSLRRAVEAVTAITVQVEKYGAVVEQLIPGGIEEEPGAVDLPPIATRESHDSAIAMAWLEAILDSKLEFVRFDDLKLPFKAALRVRESSGQHQAGDLITSLDGRLFESLDQAVAALRPSLRLGNTRVSEDSTVQRGGLAGRRVKWDVSKSWPIDYLQPTTPVRATVGMEVRVRGAKPEEIETGYVTGTCVSLDGLVVIPFSAKSLVETEPAIAFGSIKGTARIVASDDQRGLTLLKLESPGHQLFGWLKCRTGLPTKGQRLELFENINYFYQVSVSAIGQPYPAPHVGTDGFVATVSRSGTAPIGAPLMSVENELQGIVVESKRPQNEPEQANVATPEPLQRNFAIPAVHIQKLIDEYRRTASQQKPEAQTLLKVPAEGTLNAEEAAALILEKLGVKFGKPVDAKGVRSPFRGGIPIVEVVAKSAAANSGFRKGDLLVGLNNVETLTLDNVAFVLHSPEVQEKSNKFLSVRAHLVRDGEVLFADVVLTAK